jgi:hypothetical protein
MEDSSPLIVFDLYLSFLARFLIVYWILQTYVRRVYRGHVRSPTRQELLEPNHPRDVIGSHRGISVDSLLVQRI